MSADGVCRTWPAYGLWARPPGSAPDRGVVRANESAIIKRLMIYIDTAQTDWTEVARGDRRTTLVDDRIAGAE